MMNGCGNNNDDVFYFLFMYLKLINMVFGVANKTNIGPLLNLT